ncbi:MAG TPA: hypothetical protein VF635_04795 [Propionibacteriaceae bacterium]|jgi:hypothetical protein
MGEVAVTDAGVVASVGPAAPPLPAAAVDRLPVSTEPNADPFWRLAAAALAFQNLSAQLVVRVIEGIWKDERFL